MTNPHGTPIWYELLSAEPDRAKRFYEAVVGWTIHPADPGGMDYRMIDAGGGAFVGGLAGHQPGQSPPQIDPGWHFYVGVDDVDATVARIATAGGSVRIPAFDLPGVGRMAYVADPQGNPFYVMRGASTESSTAWDRTGMGKCNWNELTTTDQAAGNDFYANVFGWSFPGSMPMGDMGDYIFVAVGDETIGATMRQGSPEQPAGWLFYFRAPDIDVAADTVRTEGGTVHAGPMDVPGGDRIIVASDPMGAPFGIVAPGGKGE
ncbi:VOC family protein [Sphingomonas sp. 1P06PA]|uniref:VOC family protein n=1 Tax=Sphingomonas sp. 1P06PA TaxID=554121 RepID=UPI0039A42834